MATISFPKCSIEILPEQEVINNIITATEAGAMVDRLNDNWWSQFIAYSRVAVTKASKTITSYDDASKVVSSVIDGFKGKVMAEFEARIKEVETTLVGEAKVDKLNSLTTSRARVDNNIKSGKSVIVNTLKHGEAVLRIVDDGGHILFRKDGQARGKTEMQTLLKKAKSHAEPPKSDLEKAMDAAATLSRRLVPLNASERKLVLDTMKTKLAELDAEQDEIEVEDKEEEEAVKKAA